MPIPRQALAVPDASLPKHEIRGRSPIWRRVRLAKPLAAIVCGLLLASVALAEPPPGNMAQLQQLNRSNAAALWDMQHPVRPRSTTSPKSLMKKSLDQRQRADQQWLQEKQRRELLLLNQRAQTIPRPGVPYSLDSIHMRLRFQQEQQNQLNRFRQQQLSPLR
jgi:hypothetical protein